MDPGLGALLILDIAKIFVTSPNRDQRGGGGSRIPKSASLFTRQHPNSAFHCDERSFCFRYQILPKKDEKNYTFSPLKSPTPVLGTGIGGFFNKQWRET